MARTSMECFYTVDFIDVFTLDFIMFSWAITNMVLDSTMCILKFIMPTSDFTNFSSIWSMVLK